MTKSIEKNYKMFRTSTSMMKCAVFSSLYFILILNMSVFILNISGVNSHNVGTDTFVSKAGFWIIKYVVPGFSCYICIIAIKEYKIIYRVINDLFTMNRNMKGIHNITSKHILIELYVFGTLFGFISLIVLEMVYNNSNFLSLWCMYIPSVIVNLYGATIAFVIGMCAKRLKYLNGVLKKSSTQSLVDKIVEIQCIDHSNRKHNTGNLFRNFLTYGKIYNIVCDINKICGRGIVIYMVIGVTMELSLTYSYLTRNDVTSYADFPYKVNLSREYCLAIFLLGIWLLADISHYLQNEAEKTNLIVYELVHLGPNTNEEIILHGLQILNQKIKISAAGFFNIDYDITPELIILFFTHLSVFIQINEYYQ